MTITFKLNNYKTFAHKVIDGIGTGEWHNVESSQAYLKWLAEGNTPLPAENA